MNPIDAIILLWLVFALFVLAGYAIVVVVSRWFEIKTPRFILLSLLLIVAVGLMIPSFVAIIWHYSRLSNTPAYVLGDEDVEGIVAEIYGFDQGALQVVPPTEIPKEYVPPILEALRPIFILGDRKKYWNELPRLGKMTIRKRDGTQVEVEWHMWGQNPLAYEYNGVLCYRRGSYHPMYDMVEADGTRLGYGDESWQLARMIEQIHRELVTGVKSDWLAESAELLECSRGKRPPKSRL